MAKTQIISGIDIGTDTIKLLTVKKEERSGKIIDVLFFDKIESLGVQKGRIKNVSEVEKELKNYFLGQRKEKYLSLMMCLLILMGS